MKSTRPRPSSQGRYAKKPRFIGPVRPNYLDAPRRKMQPTLNTTEIKYNDNSGVADATTTSTVVSLNTMAAGDTVLLRDGNKILSKSVEIRMLAEQEAANVNAVVRVVVVHDQNANGTAPTWTQVMDDTAGVNVWNVRRISNMSRFTILMDKTFAINNQGTGPQKYFMKKYLTVPPECQLTSFADGTSAVPISGSLSLMYISDVAAGINDTNVTVITRLRFIG